MREDCPFSPFELIPVLSVIARFQTLLKSSLNSELLMCRKIGCNQNFRNRVDKTEFGRIVLNLIFYFGSITKVKGVDITFF
jgi:hypothetical protein